MFLRRFPRQLPSCYAGSVSRLSLFSTMTVQELISAPAKAAYSPRYIDIGINLTDPIYRGGHRHPDDLTDVIERAKEVGCSKLIVTGSDIKNSRGALDLAKEYPGVCFATAGIHPCSSSVFSANGSEHDIEGTAPCGPDPSAPINDIEPEPTKSAQVIAELSALLADTSSSNDGSFVAMGEFGLDYDRLHFCNKAVQLHSFEAQLKVAAALQPQLPLFLHSRAAHRDFVTLLKNAFGERLERLEKGGVVHSFTGTIEEMQELMDLGLHIGVNGCSLKTAENCAMVKEVRLDRLMLETDGPWCEVRPSHEGYKYLIEKKLSEEPAQNGVAEENAQTGKKQQPKKTKGQKKEPDVPNRFKVVKKEKWEKGAMIKGRNEPCTIERVAKIVAAIKGVSIEELCEVSWKNTVDVFGLGETR